VLESQECIILSVFPALLVLNAGFHSFYAFRLHPEALDDTKGHFYVIFLFSMPFYWFYAFLGYRWQGGAFFV